MSWPPPLASEDDIGIVFSACRAGHAMVSKAKNNQTERYLLEVWESSFAQLQKAVAEHIELERKVYSKVREGRQVALEANVTLYEGLDIYVEMKIQAGWLVIVAAHAHDTNPLPQ